MFHTDGALFEDVFGTPEMRDIFDEDAFVNRFLEVEAALARAEATLGIVPQDAADEMTAKASVEHLDREELAANVAEMHLFSIALIDAWKSSLGKSGEYVHWGGPPARTSRIRPCCSRSGRASTSSSETSTRSSTRWSDSRANTRIRP
ncbi:MAG: hypothetical protein ABEJ55_01535 [Halanaeroarchaeum sp.]